MNDLNDFLDYAKQHPNESFTAKKLFEIVVKNRPDLRIHDPRRVIDAIEDKVKELSSSETTPFTSQKWILTNAAGSSFYYSLLKAESVEDVVKIVEGSSGEDGCIGVSVGAFHTDSVTKKHVQDSVKDLAQILTVNPLTPPYRYSGKPDYQSDIVELTDLHQHHLVMGVGDTKNISVRLLKNIAARSNTSDIEFSYPSASGIEVKPRVHRAVTNEIVTFSVTAKSPCDIVMSVLVEAVDTLVVPTTVTTSVEPCCVLYSSHGCGTVLGVEDELLVSRLRASQHPWSRHAWHASGMVANEHRHSHEHKLKAQSNVCVFNTEASSSNNDAGDEENQKRGHMRDLKNTHMMLYGIDMNQAYDRKTDEEEVWRTVAAAEKAVRTANEIRHTNPSKR
eukprot:PhF_6_TR25292/c0_g1_i2/m.34904